MVSISEHLENKILLPSQIGKLVWSLISAHNHEKVENKTHS
jgi:hypothetical protein